MTWVNLFILTGLLSLFRPTRIDNLFRNDAKEDLRNKILFFLIFYVITLSLFKSYTTSINVVLLFAILVTAAVIIYTALLSFQLIELVFARREQTSVKVSSNTLKTFSTATQPNSIFQQFDNRIKELTGSYFCSPTTKDGDEPSGGQKTKGKFELEYLYETYPTIISTQYDDYSEKKLFALWKIGTGLFCIGLIAIFIGVMKLPGIDPALVRYHAADALALYSPGMFTSLFFILFGLAIFFFGNKLVYEVYFFFNTEIFFESNLILFKADGNYDEYEDTQGNTKRKDTFTTFTPNVKVCKITSSIFVHPYLPKELIRIQPRFLTKAEKNDVLFQQIYDGFRNNMSIYSGTFNADTSSTIEIEDADTKQLE